MENGKVEIALSKFRKPYNCAQTVYAAFKGGDAEGLEELSKCGGGKAPEGLCGALYSAVKLCPGAADKIREEFSEATGSQFCREIKTVYRTPCEKCVEVAAKLVCENISPESR